MGVNMKKVVIINNEQIKFESIRKISDGMIYTWKRNTYSSVDTVKKYDGKCEYYFIGNFDEEELANLDYAKNLFKSRFFRSLTRDKFSITEIIILAMLALNSYLVFQMQSKLGEFLEYLAI